MTDPAAGYVVARWQMYLVRRLMIVVLDATAVDASGRFAHDRPIMELSRWFRRRLDGDQEWVISADGTQDGTVTLLFVTDKGFTLC